MQQGRGGLPDHPGIRQLNLSIRNLCLGGAPTKASNEMCNGYIPSKARAVDDMGGSSELKVLLEGASKIPPVTGSEYDMVPYEMNARALSMLS